jgi:tetratricopeptide (TPR) repeat protein
VKNIESVAEMKSAFLDADFNNAWKHCANIPWPEVSKRAENGSLDDLTALSMCAELHDYRGDFSGAAAKLDKVSRSAEERIRSLVDKMKGMPISIRDRQILKRLVWILVQVATVNYRLFQLDRAESLLRLCETAIVDRIRIKHTYSCYSTLAKIYYGIGLIYRERFQKTAKEYFLKSIELSYESMREKQGKSMADKRVIQDRSTDFAIAKALALGLGFVYHYEGQANSALPVLLSAKTLLARLDEKLISTYVDLIFFDARRSAYGNDPAIVDESIEGLVACHKFFEDVGHDLYRARCAFSLAHAYSQRAREDENKPLTRKGEEDLAQAEHYSDELVDYGVEARDPRVELYSGLCMSRIERKRDHLEEAETIATKTIDHGGRAHPHIHIASLIARAEARLRMGKVAVALTDFKEAMESAGSNFRSRSICLLHMTALYAKAEQSKSASWCFAEWLQIRPHVLSAYMSRLEQAAQAAIEGASKDFVVRLAEERLNPENLERQLHRFLVDWASNRAKTDVAAAKLLGISRHTLLNWRSTRLS